jgi:hypothetical protein
MSSIQCCTHAYIIIRFLAKGKLNCHRHSPPLLLLLMAAVVGRVVIHINTPKMYTMLALDFEEKG